MINHTRDELDFLRRHGINPNNLRTRWEWVNQETATAFYEEVICPHFDNSPNIKGIENLGYRGFLNAIKKTGNTHNDYLIKLGLKPNFEIKYADMNFGELVDFFQEVIYPKLKKKLDLEKNVPPLKEHIEKNGYRGFLDRIYKTNHQYEDLLRSAGFKPTKEYKYKGKTYQELVNMFINKIYPKLVKNKIVERGTVPTKDEVRYNDYSGLIKAIRKLDRSWNNLLRDAGFKLNRELIYKDMNYQELLNYFQNIICPKIKKKYNLGEKEAPLYDQIELHYRGFLGALTRSGKKYSELLLDTEFELNYGKYSYITSFEELVEVFKNEIYPDILRRSLLKEPETPSVEMLQDLGYGDFITRVYSISNYTRLVSDIGLEARKRVEFLVGINLHPILELFLMKYIHQLDCISYFEITPNLNSLTRIDNSILRNLNFREKIEKKQSIIKIPNIIQIINIDYTIGSRRRGILLKLNKGYQGKKKYLIIVYLGSSKKQIELPNEIPYKKHSVILNQKKFAKFMGFSGNWLAEYNYVIKLAQNALFIPKAFEDLRTFSKEAKKELKKYANQQKTYEKDMKNQGLDDILNEDISDFNLDKWLVQNPKEVSDKENSKEKSMDSPNYKEKTTRNIMMSICGFNPRSD